MAQFEDLSNEVILCVWDQLSSSDVLYSFCHLNRRINSLLSEFHGLYKELDISYCSLSACRFLCRQVPATIEWRLGLTTLKLGDLYRCCQLDMFAVEVRKFIVQNHFARQGKKSANMSKDVFHLLMAYSKNLEPLFPHLQHFSIFQSVLISDDYRGVLLYGVAGGSSLRDFSWVACSNQTHYSKFFFSWLFRSSPNLLSYQLQTPSHENKGFELQYEETLIDGYLPHLSLLDLTINIANWKSLNVLLHYLPQLEYLDAYVHDPFRPNATDSKQATNKFNSPTKLRVLHLRCLKIVGPDCSCLERLLEKFHGTLETFSLDLTHYCNGELDICFDGHRLAALCTRLFRLRSLRFAIQLKFCERPSRQILVDFLQAFRTPFWLEGSFGRLRACVNYHEVFRCVQIYSLPYPCSANTVFRSIDLLDVLFNDHDEEKEIPIDLSRAFEPLWHGMKWLMISLLENQKIPLLFLRALQSSHSRDKLLVLSHERGILPDDRLQLTHFSTLQLMSLFETECSYDFQQSVGWLRLLPNVKCLFLSSDELKSWFTDFRDHEDLNTFLGHLEQLYVDCSRIVSLKCNEEIMEPLLSFVLHHEHFPQLKCLRFILCKHIQSAWSNLDQWIEFIFHRIHQHQLQFFRFDFSEKEYEITDRQTDAKVITTTEPQRLIHIQQFVSETQVAFWIERK